MAKSHLTLPLLTEQDIQQFHSKVNYDPGQGPNGDCYEWRDRHRLVGTSKHRYALTTVRGVRGKNFLVHRLAYYISFKIDPQALQVLHRCDRITPGRKTIDGKPIIRYGSILKRCVMKTAACVSSAMRPFKKFVQISLPDYLHGSPLLQNTASLEHG